MKLKLIFNISNVNLQQKLMAELLICAPIIGLSPKITDTKVETDSVSIELEDTDFEGGSDLFIQRYNDYCEEQGLGIAVTEKKMHFGTAILDITLV